MMMIWSGEVLRFGCSQGQRYCELLGNLGHTAMAERGKKRKKGSMDQIKCDLSARGQRRGMADQGLCGDGISHCGFLAFCIPRAISLVADRTGFRSC